MLTAALFSMAKRQKQSQCLSTGDGRTECGLSIQWNITPSWKGNVDTRYDIDGAWGCYTTWNKPAAKRQTLSFHLPEVPRAAEFTEPESWAWVARAGGEEGAGSWCLTALEFQFAGWTNWGAGWWRLLDSVCTEHYQTTQLKMVQMVNFPGYLDVM